MFSSRGSIQPLVIFCNLRIRNWLAHEHGKGEDGEEGEDGECSESQSKVAEEEFEDFE